MSRLWNIRRVVTVIAVTGLLGATVGCSTGGGAATEEPSESGPIKIGVPIPVTGPVAATGDWARMGIEMAAEEINANGGINGREVELVVADTEGDPTKANTAMTRLVQQDQVDLVVGPITSDESLATMPILTQANIPSMNGSGSEITAENSPYSFAMLINAVDQAKAMVRFSTDRGTDDMALLNYTATQGKAAVRGWDEAFADAKLTPAGHEEFDAPASDLTPQLLKLKATDADTLLFFAQTGKDTGTLSVNMDQLGWDVPVIGSYGTTFAAQAIAIGGPETYQDFDSVFWPAFAACTVNEIRPEVADFIERFYSGFDASRTENAAVDYVAIYHDALIILAAGVEATGSTDGDVVAKWIEENGASEAESLPVVHQGFAMSASNHFLMDSDSLVLVNAGTEVGEKVFQRVDC